MSRRPTVEPRWLDSMLFAWGRIKHESVGWYRINPMLKSGIPSSTPSFDPWDITPREIDQLDEEIAKLPKRLKDCILMCYKPWRACQLSAFLEEHKISQRTQQRWLHEAVAVLEKAMAARLAEEREMAC